MYEKGNIDVTYKKRLKSSHAILSSTPFNGNEKGNIPAGQPQR